MPPKMAVPRIARGIARRGSRVSSPRVAAASKPANDRKPKTEPLNTSPRPVPLGGLNTSRVKLWLPGVSPLMSLMRTIVATTTISETVRPSAVSNTRAALRAGQVPSRNAPARATRPMMKPAPFPGLFQMPIRSRKSAPKMPAAMLVTHA